MGSPTSKFSKPIESFLGNGYRRSKIRLSLPSCTWSSSKNSNRYYSSAWDPFVRIDKILSGRVLCCNRESKLDTRARADRFPD